MKCDQTRSCSLPWGHGGACTDVDRRVERMCLLLHFAHGISAAYDQLRAVLEELDFALMDREDAQLLVDIRDAVAHHWIPCPLCQGNVRQTVGMVCSLCGTDYGRKP